MSKVKNNKKEQKKKAVMSIKEKRAIKKQKERERKLEDIKK